MTERTEVHTHICMIASHLFQGGFTSSMVYMIKALQKRNVQIDVLLLDAKNNQISIDVLAGCNIIPFQLKKANIFDFKRSLRIKEDQKQIDAIEKEINTESNEDTVRLLGIKKTQLAIEVYVLGWMPIMDLRNYDAVISWEELTCNYFLAYNVQAKFKLGYVHPDYCTAGFDAEIDGKAFSRFDRLAGECDASVKSLLVSFPGLANKIVEIPNELDSDTLLKRAEAGKTDFIKSDFDIVTVCRLSVYHKGLDRLLDVAERLNKDGFSFNWYIIGDGDGQSFMKKTISEKGLNNVHLLGGRDNPYPDMKRADLFALLSNYEGRSVVVDEAVVLKIPVLITNYQSAHEQVNENSGYVVDMNNDAVYEKMKEILQHPNILEELYADDSNGHTSQSGADILLRICTE